MSLTISMTESQNVPVNVTPRTKKGTLALVQDPSFSLTFPEGQAPVVEMEVIEPGKSIKLKGLSGSGAALLTYTADADMGEGVVPLIGTADIVVTAGMATQVELVAGPPEEQAP